MVARSNPWEKKMDKVKKILINIAGTLAFPVIVFVVFYAVTHIFNTPSEFGFNLIPNVVQNIGVGILIALGMSVNMATFRIDLSAGAVTTLTAILVGTIAIDNGWPGWLFMIGCIVCGVICSTFNGAVYAFLRLPSMIVSLGVTMILESITVIFRGGVGIVVYDGPIRAFGGAPTIFIILIVCMALFHVVMEYTGFGFDQKAFAGNKKIAVENGKKERLNVIISYAFSGIFFGLAALPYINYFGTVEAASDMSSASVMFDAMLPVLIGTFIARFSNQVIAIVVAVFSMKMMSYGLICCGFNNTMQNVVSGVMIICMVFISARIQAGEHKKNVAQRVEFLNQKRDAMQNS